MAELNVSVVAVDGLVWEGPAKSVVLKTVEGDIGLLPGHEPLLAILADAPVRIETDEGKRIYAVHGGFVSLDSNTLAILADSAETASEINLEQARAALAEAESGDREDPTVLAAIRMAETQITVVETDTR